MWHVVVPLRGWQAAKSRTALPEAERAELAAAMVADTLAVVADSDAVSHLTVLVADHDLVGSPVLSVADDVVVQPDAALSLNPALGWFAASLGDARTPLAVVVADIPAARTRSLTTVLTAARNHRSAMVADRAGTGTTVLTAIRAAALAPRFGTGSALAHQGEGAVLLPGTPDLACDVDTMDELTHAKVLGLGPHTSELVARLWR